jgi:MoaA/NifB/PqqE/SkfB family radical SAM enzyme
MSRAQTKTFESGSMVSPPTSIAILITGRCNATCAYCPYQRGIINFPKDPTRKEIERRIAEAAAMGVGSVRFSGGEPLIRRDLEDLVEFAKRHGLTPTIVTNGSLLTKNRLEKLLKAGIGAITFSIDTLEVGLYESLRGLPFSHVRRNLQMIKALQGSWKERPWIGVTTVITRHNISQVIAMTEYLSGMDIPVQYQPCHSYSHGKENQANQPDTDEIEQVVRSLIELKARGYLVNNSIRYLEGIVHFVRFGRPPADFRCHVPWQMAVYDGNLHLRPCCFPLPPISNSEVDSFEESWNSAEMNGWRERISRMDCPGCWLLSLDEWK